MSIAQLRKPPRLKPGMTIGVVAPSGPAGEQDGVGRALAAIRALGFEVVPGRRLYDTYGYLAGADADRAADLLEMLERDDVDGVICLRGGYGAIRTAMALDRQRLARLAARPPKPFVGYSDITVLHALLRRELGWHTFYGPMATSLIHPSDYTLAAFRRALMERAPFSIDPDPDDPYVETLVAGRAEGRLLGGCLSLVVSLIGTPWEIDLDGAIFFFEDVHEPPYRVDRMLAQLRAAGKLDRCAGIVVGEHVDCAPGAGGSLRLEQVLRDLLVPLGLPTLYHLPIGHGRHLATLPLGAWAELNATERRLRILEPAVE